MKDSFGHAAFFATFEYVKAQAYYGFITKYYGDLQGRLLAPALTPKLDTTGPVDVIRPHYGIEPAFLMLAGITASIAQQIIQHPLNLIQVVYFKSVANADKSKIPKSVNLVAYKHTYQKCLFYAQQAGSWRKWLYRGFLINTIKQVPSTSAGLVIFELVRRRYASEAEAVRIVKDGYDLLLP
ncbi:hypothetical protein P7C71_g5241, partial [Lecanoromycetidae sp. Uapishka_2]